MAGGARDIGYAVRRDRSAYIRVPVIRPLSALAAEADDTLRIRRRHSTGLGGILGPAATVPVPHIWPIALNQAVSLVSLVKL